jgi:outer membrane protein OmpA-like peptidoglycan-associated protein
LRKSILNRFDDEGAALIKNAQPARRTALQLLANGKEVSTMKGLLATICIASAALLAAGCATHKYVRNTTAPIQAKLDQVGEQASRNDQSIGDTKNQVKQVDENAQSGINAAQERASTADQHALTADQHAGDAMNSANQAGQTASQAVQSADRANQGLESLRNVIANIDDYKLQSSATVPFKFNQSVLTTEGQEDLDKLAEGIKSTQRFFVAVEGYTDDVGNKQYNEQLSNRRADSVAEYLVAKHDVPIYRIHMIGLGKEKPVDEGHNRAARAKNRRVEVKVFTADQVTASLGGSDVAAR